VTDRVLSSSASWDRHWRWRRARRALRVAAAASAAAGDDGAGAGGWGDEGADSDETDEEDAGGGGGDDDDDARHVAWCERRGLNAKALEAVAETADTIVEVPWPTGLGTREDRRIDSSHRKH